MRPSRREQARAVAGIDRRFRGSGLRQLIERIGERQPLRSRALSMQPAVWWSTVMSFADVREFRRRMECSEVPPTNVFVG